MVSPGRATRGIGGTVGTHHAPLRKILAVPEIESSGAYRARYRIEVPAPKSFANRQIYYRTAIQGVGQWMGHPSRLKRPALADGIGQGLGSREYAREFCLAANSADRTSRYLTTRVPAMLPAPAALADVLRAMPPHAEYDAMSDGELLGQANRFGRGGSSLVTPRNPAVGLDGRGARTCGAGGRACRYPPPASPSHRRAGSTNRGCLQADADGRHDNGLPRSARGPGTGARYREARKLPVEPNTCWSRARPWRWDRC